MSRSQLVSSNVLFFVLFASLQYKMAFCLTVNLSPKSSIETIQKEVSISCDPQGSSINAREILLVEILKDNNPIAIIRQGSTITYKIADTKRLQAEGRLDRVVDDTYFNLTIMFPRVEDSGVYTCTMSYLDDNDILKQIQTSNTLVVDKLDVTKTFVKVEQLEKLVNSLLNRTIELETKKNNLEEKMDFVSAFSVTNANNIYPKSSSYIVFNRVLMKQGEGYNETTGVFTAPKAGVYAFHLYAELGSSGKGGEISIMANNKELAKLYSRDKDYGDQSSVSSVVDLKADDEVKVKAYSLSGSDPYLYSSNLSGFSGYLIKQH